MANILKRPMFSRGGSASRGTGITSGLERQGYKQGMLVQPGISEQMISERLGDGAEDILARANTLTGTNVSGLIDDNQVTRFPQPEQDQLQDDLDEQMQKDMMEDSIISSTLEDLQPTTGDRLEDMAAAIASTAPDDPRQLQSIGQFLAKAGAGATGLRRQRQEQIGKFKQDVAIQRLKNLDEGEKDQLFRYARKYSEQTGMPLKEAYKKFLDRYLQGTPSKGLDSQILTRDYQDKLMSDLKGYPSNEALNIARTQVKIFQGEAPNVPEAPPKTDFSDPSTYEDLRPGKYIDPASGDIYQIDEQGQPAEKIWPK